jgi:hypothetical protein
MPPAPAVRIRAYNVRFGDCVLVSFDAGAGPKHVLFDFGNAPSGVRSSGGKNDVFASVAADIAQQTGGVIDLLVMSHEHLDHMEGFYSERTVFDRCTVRQVWMSLMSATDYYKRFPNCEPEKSARLALLDVVRRWDRQRRFARLPEPVRALIANNVLMLANKDRIDYLRALAGKKNVKYLRRGSRVSTAALGAGVKMQILAPEADASVYYKRDPRLWLAVAARLGSDGRGRARRRRSAPPVSARGPRAPEQMAPDEFAQLREQIAALDLADLLAIDKAANNTSLVVRLTVHDKVLLFPGDAEEESWAEMRSRNLLRPVDFLKIAHHGSVNGMPFEGAESVLDRVVKPGKHTIALVSTCRDVYGKTVETEIPHHRLMETLERKCRTVHTTQDAADFGEGFDILL